MFTIKLYASQGGRQRIVEGESFTILRDKCSAPDDGSAEITVHQKNPSEDRRYDVSGAQAAGGPDVYERAIIENSAGKTTEIIALRPMARSVANFVGGPVNVSCPTN